MSGLPISTAFLLLQLPVLGPGTPGIPTSTVHPHLPSLFPTAFPSSLTSLHMLCAHSVLLSRQTSAPSRSNAIGGTGSKVYAPTEPVERLSSLAVQHVPNCFPSSQGYPTGFTDHLILLTPPGVDQADRSRGLRLARSRHGVESAYIGELLTVGAMSITILLFLLFGTLFLGVSWWEPGGVQATHRQRIRLDDVRHEES